MIWLENPGLISLLVSLASLSFLHLFPFSFGKITEVNWKDVLKSLTKYSRLSVNGNLYKTDTSVKRTPRVGPCLSLFPLFDSL